MTLYISLSTFFLILFLIEFIGQAHPSKLKLKSHIKQSPVEKKTHLHAPAASHVTGSRRFEHPGPGPCFMPVPVGTDASELHVHIHEENPCKNGGIMRMGEECRFRCLCPPQFGGSLCEDHLYCYWNPCKNGGTCKELGHGFECTCKERFKGPSCEEIDPCNPNPCSYHSTCVENLNGFKCVCKDGYKGKKCEDVDPCLPNPCRNSGVCTDIKGVVTCACIPPYKGTFCTDILICYHNPCYHNGVCVENPVAPCICKRGYIGIHCEDHVCNPSPCINGGICRVINSRGHHKWTFKCVCPRGFTGALCHIPHPCSVNICLNGGTCIDANTDQETTEAAAISPAVLDYYCKCIVGFTGKKCETKLCDLCDKNAECINNRCICKKNFTGNGFHCEPIVDPCQPNPCKNKGVCELGPDGSYSCKCVMGYCGPHCESDCNPCASGPCKNGGTCHEVRGSYVCICPPGFTGPRCEIPLPNPCDSNPCQNGGTCERIPEKNDYRCLCKGKFTGKNCEVCDCPKGKPFTKKLIALDQKCDLEGECNCPFYKGQETTYVPGFGCVPKGGQPCASNPCKNGGRCKDVGTVQNPAYECLCREPFYGTNCECTECTCNFPCLNNGICEDISTHQYKCTCPKGFTGANCEAIIPTVGPRPCLGKPCLNGGTCTDRKVGYDCICKPQFTGPHCEVDKCAECDMNADCVYGKCRCRKGYIGTGYYCEKEKGCEEVVCPIHHHCLHGLCICLPDLVC